MMRMRRLCHWRCSPIFAGTDGDALRARHQKARHILSCRQHGHVVGTSTLASLLRLSQNCIRLNRQTSGTAKGIGGRDSARQAFPGLCQDLRRLLASLRLWFGSARASNFQLGLLGTSVYIHRKPWAGRVIGWSIVLCSPYDRFQGRPSTRFLSSTEMKGGS